MKYSSSAFLSFLLIIVISVSCITTLDAQRRRKAPKLQRFGAGLILGTNLSQIDGDRYTGFDKAGLYGGARGIVRFNSQLEINVELLYSQKGSKIEEPDVLRTGAGRTLKNRVVQLNYAEVPILLRYVWYDTGKGFMLETGAAFSRLNGIEITERLVQDGGVSYDDLSERFNRNDLNYVVGGGFRLNKHIDLLIRYTFALTRFYEQSAEETAVTPNPFAEQPIKYLRNYHLSLLAAYVF